MVINFIKENIIYKLVITIVIVIVLFNTFLNNQIEHFGWDGEKYANIFINFEELFLNKKIFTYYFQRCLPFASFHYLFKVFKIEFSESNIVLFMKILNTTLIISSIYLINQIFNHHKIKTNLKTLGIILIFCNYHILKFAGYYPVLTDIISYFLTILILYLYVKRNQNLILIVSFFGTFIFPTIFVIGAIAYIQLQQSENKKIILSINHKIIISSILCLSFSLFGFFFYKTYIGALPIPQEYTINNLTIKVVSYLSLIIYIGILTINIFKNFKLEINKNNINSIFTTLLIYSISKLITNSYSNTTQIDGIGPSSFLINILHQAVSTPFNFLGSHFMYFGLIYILIISNFKNLMIYIKKNQIIFIFIIFFFCWIMLGNESRQFLNCVPIFTILFINYFNKESTTISNKNLVYLFIFQIIISKFWIVIPSKILDFSNVNGRNYRYFISQGPWTPVAFQFAWTILFLITLFVFYKYRNSIFIQNKIDE